MANPSRIVRCQTCGKEVTIWRPKDEVYSTCSSCRDEGYKITFNPRNQELHDMQYHGSLVE